MRRLFTGLAAVAVLFAAAPAPAQDAQNRPKDDPVVYFAPDDEAMNAAVAQAKESLPEFWRRIASDKKVADTASIKVGFPVKGGGHEFMWLSELKREGGKVTGRLDNSPEMDVGVALGDIVTVKVEDITDWTYFSQGRLYGGFTIRVMLKDLPAASARDLLELLSDEPLESGLI